jgi:hypothetical protein
MTDTLKPCPFCGEDVYILRLSSPISGNGEYLIDCCATMSKGFVLGIYKPKKEDTERYAKAALIKLWNAAPRG